MNNEIFARHGLDKIKGGVLHLGAHLAQEFEFYHSRGAEFVVWVEANPDKFSILRRMMNESNFLVEAAVSNEDGKVVLRRYWPDDWFSLLLPGKDMLFKRK